MHPNSIYAAIKTVLANLTNIARADITSGKTLGGNWPSGLNFTSAGVAGLIQNLNEHFDSIGHRPTPILHPGEASPASKVGDLFSLIRPRVH
jgi:hypothetical protein